MIDLNESNLKETLITRLSKLALALVGGKEEERLLAGVLFFVIGAYQTGDIKNAYALLNDLNEGRYERELAKLKAEGKLT